MIRINLTWWQDRNRQIFHPLWSPYSMQLWFGQDSFHVFAASRKPAQKTRDGSRWTPSPDRNGKTQNSRVQSSKSFTLGVYKYKDKCRTVSSNHIQHPATNVQCTLPGHSLSGNTGVGYLFDTTGQKQRRSTQPTCSFNTFTIRKREAQALHLKNMGHFYLSNTCQINSFQLKIKAFI